MEYVKAFIVGGIICAIVQVLMDKTKLMPGRIMVLQNGVLNGTEKKVRVSSDITR